MIQSSQVHFLTPKTYLCKKKKNTLVFDYASIPLLVQVCSNCRKLFALIKHTKHFGGNIGNDNPLFVDENPQHNLVVG